MIQVIGFDPGFGNTKVCVDGQVAVIQSAVVRPRSIGRADIGMKSYNAVPHITFEGQTFATGPGVWHWGTTVSSLDYSALASMERRALFYSALSEVLEPGAYTLKMLVVGLPVNLLQDKTQADIILENLKRYKGKHHFEIKEQIYDIQIARTKVLAQPAGAYANWLFNEDFKRRKEANNAEVAILDIGMNTLDLYALHNGRVEPRFVGGGKVGVRRLLSILNQEGYDLAELDAKLRTHKLRPSKQALESWLGEILAAIELVWPSLRRFDAIIPVGGGASILGDTLRLALISKGAVVHWLEDPIIANVIGFWKWGTYGLR